MSLGLLNVLPPSVEYTVVSRAFPQSVSSSRLRDFIVQRGASVWGFDRARLLRAFEPMETYAGRPMYASAPISSRDPRPDSENSFLGNKSLDEASPSSRFGDASLIRLQSGPGFIHQVEGCLGRSTETREASGTDDLAHARLAGLCTEAQSHLL